MAYSYRAGAIVTFCREDGQHGPGSSETYKAVDGWKVDIQDEGCVEITNYGAETPVPSRIVPWHRIYEIRTI